MRRGFARRVVKVLAIGAVALVVFGGVTMALWNWLLPTLFGWPAIGFWQAIGLLVLCRTLFGRLGRCGGVGRADWRRRLAERWEKMTPEEREQLRASWRHGCGPFGRSGDPGAQTPA